MPIGFTLLYVILSTGNGKEMLQIYSCAVHGQVQPLSSTAPSSSAFKVGAQQTTDSILKHT